ncbi:DUF4959 domain-containing protein [Niabella soli]|uniref:DUF4959 domain-containing protein n=1 Tax=Niabella soli DSM 19437 TaxID=929713 RepID=W0EZH8_9BACT|nr:DUF4959 domain-containing protein [Niabella soli]AHF14511.1 hypothetical protein NIASO_03505 [Niabella soli DSM 19437]
MNKYSLLAAIIITGFLFSCRKKDQEPSQGGVWNSGPVEVGTVTPINGGATIAYKVPDDNDLLYVMAEYKRNGKMFTDKSSVYNNSLTIEGFDTIGTVAARIYKVNKAGQRSAGADVTFTPLQSLVSIAQNSLKLEPGFGGVVASWNNPKSTPLGVRFMYLDSTNKLTTNQMYFTTVPQELHAFRGFAPNPTKFAVSFEDKWGNSSDTTYYNTTPFFETLVPKPYADYRANIPYDNTSNLSGRSMPALWDNIVNTSGSGWLTNPGAPGLSITIDLKQVVKLSRIIIWGYHINSPYGQANFTQFELWGVNKIDPALFANKPYWLDSMSVVNGALSPAPANINPTTVLPDVTFKNDWQYLGWYAITRYDKMVPVDQQAILNLSQNGMEYTMPLDAKPVRYLRLFVREITGTMPPPANNYFSCGEISVYGDNTVPQQ